MLSFVAALVLLAPEVPPECQAPPARDVTPLSGFAQRSGSLSVGLDSVATWCFDSGGKWTGGHKPVKGKLPTALEPTGDCSKAILSCETAKAALTDESRQLLFDTLGELEQPFLGVKYKPKRSGLAERPPEVAKCSARDRSTLFAQAQARMDLARLASQAQSEYANYRTWLFAEGLKCAQAIARGEKDYTRRGVNIDKPVEGGGTQQVPGAARDGGALAAGTGGATAGGTTAGATAGATTAGGSTTGGAAAGGAMSGTTSAGGSTAGGSTAGGTAAGGMVAGGMVAGTTTAGGTAAGGTTAGGTTAGATVGGATAGATVGGTTAGATVGGTTAGGAAAGGTTAGAATVGGATAGGTAAGGTTVAGTTAGGATAGGATAGGATAGATTAGGAVAGAATVGGTKAGAATVGGTTVGGPAAPGTTTGIAATGGTGPSAPGGATAGGQGGLKTLPGVPVPAGAGRAMAAGASSTSPTPGTLPGAAQLPVGGPTAEREKALASSLLDKWRYFAAERARLERDPDWAEGFILSRELRECRCARFAPADLVRRIETKDRLPALEAEDEKLTRCEVCLEDAYPPWKQRAQKQCALLLELSEFEIGALEASDDGNGLPPRCIAAARQKRTGAPVAASKPTVTAGPQGKGSAYIIAKAPEAAPASDVGDFVRPKDYAPMLEREDGRVYVRIFTSAACVAEVLPGPIQARNGDLLPVLPSAKEVIIRGPCGGIAELYFGKEEKPRVAEPFSKTQPLKLQFKK